MARSNAVKKQAREHPRTWREMVEFTNSATEDELWEAIDYEREHEGRVQYILRFHGRANILRMARERKELTDGL